MIDARHIIGAHPVLRYPIQPGQALDDAIVWAVEMYRGQHGEPLKVWVSAHSAEGKAMRQGYSPTGAYAVRESGTAYVCDGYQVAVKRGVPADQVWVM